jgi:hypothetical protein
VEYALRGAGVVKEFTTTAKVIVPDDFEQRTLDEHHVKCLIGEDEVLDRPDLELN